VNRREASLRRHELDLAAQLIQARADQDRIRHKLQSRLLALTQAYEANLSALQARHHATLQEQEHYQATLKTQLHHAHVEGEQCRLALAEALAAQIRLAEGYEQQLAEARNVLVRQTAELQGLYASLSWRLTFPLRWLNAKRIPWRRS
jgi:hypothetical protein